MKVDWNKPIEVNFKSGQGPWIPAKVVYAAMDNRYVVAYPINGGEGIWIVEEHGESKPWRTRNVPETVEKTVYLVKEGGVFTAAVNLCYATPLASARVTFTIGQFVEDSDDT